MKRKRKTCLRKPVSWLLAFALAIGLAIPQAAVYAGEPGSMDGVPAQFEEVYEPGLGSESAESYSSGEAKKEASICWEQYGQRLKKYGT